MNRVQILVHVPFETPGAIATWLTSNHFTFEETHLYRDDPIPNVDDFDSLISLGGPQSCRDLAQYPYLCDEINLMSEALISHKRVLGVCLGAQLLAEALGGKTIESPEREVGVFPISLTDLGLEDPVFGPLGDEFDVLHFHRDMCGEFPGMEVLAGNAACPIQIFAYRQLAYGIQCHFEMDLPIVNRLIDACPTELIEGQSIQSPETLRSHDYTSINQRLFGILERFFALP
jgi:GMP synthase (glutamine-hydrolysing)